MSTSLLNKLQQAWTITPHLRFGQLIESVENIAWADFERDQQRECSARLLYLPDRYFEGGLDQWIALPFRRQAVTS